MRKIAMVLVVLVTLLSVTSVAAAPASGYDRVNRVLDLGEFPETSGQSLYNCETSDVIWLSTVSEFLSDEIYVTRRFSASSDPKYYFFVDTVYGSFFISSEGVASGDSDLKKIYTEETVDLFVEVILKAQDWKKIREMLDLRYTALSGHRKAFENACSFASILPDDYVWHVYEKYGFLPAYPEGIFHLMQMEISYAWNNPEELSALVWIILIFTMMTIVLSIAWLIGNQTSRAITNRILSKYDIEGIWVVIVNPKKNEVYLPILYSLNKTVTKDVSEKGYVYTTDAFNWYNKPLWSILVHNEFEARDGVVKVITQSLDGIFLLRVEIDARYADNFGICPDRTGEDAELENLLKSKFGEDIHGIRVTVVGNTAQVFLPRLIFFDQFTLDHMDESGTGPDFYGFLLEDLGDNLYHYIKQQLIEAERNQQVLNVDGWAKFVTMTVSVDTALSLGILEDME